MMPSKCWGSSSYCMGQTLIYGMHCMQCTAHSNERCCHTDLQVLCLLHVILCWFTLLHNVTMLVSCRRLLPKFQVSKFQKCISQDTCNFCSYGIITAYFNNGDNMLNLDHSIEYVLSLCYFYVSVTCDAFFEIIVNLWFSLRFQAGATPFWRRQFWDR